MTDRKYLTVLTHTDDAHGVQVVEHADFKAAEDWLFKWKDHPQVRDVHVIAFTPTDPGGFWDCPFSTVYARRFDRVRAERVAAESEEPVQP